MQIDSARYGVVALRVDSSQKPLTNKVYFKARHCVRASLTSAGSCWMYNLVLQSDIDVGAGGGGLGR